MKLFVGSLRGGLSNVAEKRNRLFLLVAAVIAPVALSCNSGAYPFDILQEMHYQQTSRFQEPARFYPPTGSVPTTGKSGSYSQQDLATLKNPVARDARNLERGAELFRINCAPCHGPQGKGDGPLVTYFEKAGQRPPPNLTQSTTAPSLFLPDGQVFGIITNGQGKGPEQYQGLTNMPNFNNLLTEEERWTLVNYLRSISGTTSR